MRRRNAILLCGAAAVAAAVLLWPRPPTVADLKAAGFVCQWEAAEYPDWCPRWVRLRLPEQAPPRRLFAFEGWTPDSLDVLARLPLVQSLDLYGTPVTDADVRRVLRDHPGLQCLLLDETAVTDAVLPLLAESETLRKASADADGVSDAALIDAARRRPGRFDAALARRLVRNLRGAELTRYEDRELWGFRSLEAEARRGPDGREVAEGGVLWRAASASSLAPDAPSSLEVHRMDPRGVGRPHFSERQRRLLAAVHRLGELQLTGFDEAPPAGSLTGGLREASLSDCGPRAAAFFRLPIRVEARSLSWTAGEEPLCGLTVSAAEFDMDARGGHRLSGRLLRTLSAPNLEDLSVHNFTPPADVGPPLRVDFSKHPRLWRLDLAGVAVDGPSLLSFRAAAAPPGDRPWLFLKDLPHASDADLAAVVRLWAGGGGLVFLGAGMAVGAETLTAALSADGVEVAVRAESLPDAATVRRLLADLPRRGDARVRITERGDAPTADEAIAALQELAGVVVQ